MYDNGQLVLFFDHGYSVATQPRHLKFIVEINPVSRKLGIDAGFLHLPANSAKCTQRQFNSPEQKFKQLQKQSKKLRRGGNE